MHNLVTSTQVRPVSIDKSELRKYKFRKQEVLATQDAIEQRWRDLNRGMSLGNLHKLPTTLIFESAEAKLIKLEATIWGVTTKRVLLKSGLLIPINCIHDVIL